MKLLYLLAHPSDRLADERAGHVVRPRRLLAGLQEAGVQVAVVEAAGTAGAQAAARGYWRVRDALPAPVALTARDAVRVLQNERFARRASGAVRAEGADVLLETQVAFSTAGASVAAATGLPLVVDDVSPVEEDEEVYDVRLRRLARVRRRRTLRAASLVVVTSSAIRDSVVAEGVPPDRLLVLPNGVVLDGAPGPSRADLGLAADDVVVAYAGSFQAFHRLDLLVEALARPQVPARVRLLLVGDGDERPAVEALARRSGVHDRVRVTGRVPSEQVLAHLRLADVGVLPATAAWTNPMKLYDYLAAGLPVVAPRQQAVTEVLGSTPGVLFEPGSVGALAAALAQLAEDPEQRARAASDAAAAGRAHGWTARAEQLREAVEALRHSE